MSRYLRPRIPGATLFLTVALADRGSDLLVREIAAMREAVTATRTERPFRVDAWVVLPDHFHAVWTLPEGDAEYSVRVGAIKGRFTNALRGEAPVWQKRFWERNIRCEEEFAACVQYCEENPVGHGLVTRVEDWPYSSWGLSQVGACPDGCADGRESGQTPTYGTTE